MNLIRSLKNINCLYVKFQTDLKFFRFLSSKSDIILKSYLPDINIPDLPLTDFLWEKFDRFTNRTALVCAKSSKEVDYKTLYKNSRNVAAFLQSKVNLKKGDTIAIILPSVTEYVSIFLGAIDAGFVVTTINPSYTKEEIKRQLIDSEVKVVFALNNAISKVQDAVKNLENDVSIISVIEQENESVNSGIIKFNDILKCSNLKFNPVEKNAEDVALILYSSGTTGLPKGVELTHRNLISNLLQSNVEPMNCHGLFDKTVISTSMAFFHSGGIATILSTLFCGSKLISRSEFSTKTLLNEFKMFKPHVGIFTPVLIQILITNSNFTPEIIECLKYVHCAGAVLSEKDIERFSQKCDNKVRIFQGYGLTEASPQTHRVPKTAPRTKEKSVGVLLPNTEMKIVDIDNSNDEDSKGLPAFQLGEIWIRGPQVMRGYFKNSKATEETITEDGWLKTGDLGHVDDDQYLYITDRLKELIKVKGFQVAPAELEDLLRNHPWVEEAVVVGKIHEKYGEVPKAFVVLKNNEKLTEQEIKNYIANQVVHYKHLEGGVVFMDCLPKTETGKIQRKSLKDK